jgi:hypothetical protein
MNEDPPRHRTWDKIRDLVVVITSLLVEACGSAQPATQTDRFDDRGRLCALPEGAPSSPFELPRQAATFHPGRPLTLEVVFPVCLSSCRHDIQAECSAVVKGERVEVTSRAAVVTDLETACTDDCGALVARCTVPFLEPGTHEIRYGAESLLLTLPSTVVPPCAGQAL